MNTRRSFLRQVALATGGSVLASASSVRGSEARAADSAAGQPVPRRSSRREPKGELSALTTDMGIEERVRLIERFVHRHYYDPAGLMYSHTQWDEERPFTAADFSPEDSAVLVLPCPDQWLNYENSAWISGMFLASQCYRYRATGEDEALVFARRAFDSLDANYRLTEKGGPPAGPVQKAGIIELAGQPRSVEKGWFCKPYGGLATRQTSTEQHFGPLFGLYLYLPLAPAEIRGRITRIFGEVSERWRHGYRIDYFGEPWDMERSYPRAQRHMFTWAVMHRMAYEVTRDPASYDEFARLDALFGAMPTPRETALGMGMPSYYSTEDRAFHCMLVIGAEILSQLEPGRKSRYLRGMRDWWRFSFTGQRPDLLSYYFLKVDALDGAWEKLPISLSPSALWTSPWMFKNGTWPVCSYDTVQRQALTSAVVAKWAPDDEGRALRHLSRIFSGLTKAALRWYADPEGVFPKELRWMTHTLEGDSLAFYPLGYWYARANRIGI